MKIKQSFTFAWMYCSVTVEMLQESHKSASSKLCGFSCPEDRYLVEVHSDAKGVKPIYDNAVLRPLSTRLINTG
jgi:hypothetical protein